MEDAKDHHFDPTKRVILQSTIVASLLSLGSALPKDLADHGVFWQSSPEQAGPFRRRNQHELQASSSEFTTHSACPLARQQCENTNPKSILSLGLSAKNPRRASCLKLENKRIPPARQPPAMREHLHKSILPRPFGKLSNTRAPRDRAPIHDSRSITPCQPRALAHVYHSSSADPRAMHTPKSASHETATCAMLSIPGRCKTRFHDSQNVDLL